MSYTELEHGYQDLRSTSRPIFYIGDGNTVQPSLVDPVASSLYRISKRGELSDGCSIEDGCMGGSDLEGEGKQVLVGVCAMAKKSQSKPMKEILTRLEEFEYIKVVVFPEEVILKEPVEDWPIVDCLISFHSKGFPLDKAIHYANLRNPFNINNLPMQYDIQDRRRVYAILDGEGIEIPRYAVLDRDSADPKHHELVESEDHVEVNGVTFNKPFVEKPVSAEDHNIYIYYPTSAGGGSQRLFRKVRKRHSILPFTSSTGINKPNGKSYATDKLLEPIPMTGIGSRSSVYSPESRVRKTGSYIYEDFMPTDGTDVKVYTVGPDYAHAEARKSPALDGKVERDSEGKEIRYPVILSNAEKLISRKVCLAFKQTVCGFDLLRANGKSFVCDVNGFSFVKNSNKYYDDCAKILGNMILRELAPTLHIPWSVPFQLDDPPIVPTTFGKMMELRCVVAVIRHGDRTPKQKMKVEVRHPKFFEIFAKYDGYKHGHVKLKRPKQLQEILDTARSLLTEIQHRAAGPELEEKQGKLEQLKSVLEMYGHFSGINRKVQMKYQPRGRPRGSSSDDDRLGEPSLVLILKWGGELTPAGRIQAEELGRIFRCMYPGGQGRHLSEDDSEMLPSHGEYAGAQGLGLLRLHSTFRHDLKIYASDEGRVQMTAAAFAKGLLALEGELTPILVQMVKSANTNGLLDNDCDSSKYQNMVKTRLHELLQQDREFTKEDREQINPGNALSINDALDFVKNPVKCCQHVQALIQKLMDIVRIKKDDPKTKDAILYHGETWELMGRRWGKIEKDFCTKNKRFDISKIPDIYDCIKYDLQHNNHTLQFDHAEELYIYAKYLADIVIPQEYGLTVQEKLTIGQGICTPLLKKIRADLQRNIEESGEETVNRLNPRYSHGVSSPGRHVRTRLYFTSESHVHSLLTVLRYGGLLDVVTDEQWRRAMEYVSMVSELNYMSQIVVMLYEDPTKDPSSEERFHVELHFSPGVNCCVQKNLPPGPGFRPHSRNESSHNLETNSQCSTRIDEEDAELGGLEDGTTSPQQKSDASPVLAEAEETPDTTLNSPTTSRTIDMMDLDPNMMDEPYDSGFLQASAPIPISARTVAGHEAARLGSQLAASQRQRREREASGICEPRARSYDHQRQDKPEKTVEKLQYQSLDAVNKEEDTASNRFDVDQFFYEKVECLVTPKIQSTRDVGKSGSPNRPGNSANSSYFSSSPDIPSLLVDTRSVREQNQDKTTSERIPLQRGSTCTRKNVQFDRSSYEDDWMFDETDFWDFGETQIVEESPICEDVDVAGETARANVDERNLTAQEDAGHDTIRIEPIVGISSLKTIEIDEKIVSKDSPVTSPDSSTRSIGIKIKPRENALEENCSVTRSPKCLGIPVLLPHSISSPELPAPLKATVLDNSRPLVTLHSNSLASPVVSPTLCSHGSGRSDETENISLTSCTSSTFLPMSLQTSQGKRYGRSKSALTLSTGNDPRGESGPCKKTYPISKNPYNRSPIDNFTCRSCYQCGMARFPINDSHEQRKPTPAFGDETKCIHDYSTSLPPQLRASNRRSSLNEVRSDSAGSSHLPFNLRRTSFNLAAKKYSASPDGDSARGDLRFTQRSRSLSPCSQGCLCYNCNVSILIQQSVNLPPDERSNFETYFVRSLSHKLINCCCYKMSVEAANASKRASRSASPNLTRQFEFTPFSRNDFPFERSHPNLDIPNYSQSKCNQCSFLEACENRFIDRQRMKKAIDGRFDNNRYAFRSRRRSLPSFSTHDCNLQEVNPSDLPLPVNQTNSLNNGNLASRPFDEISDPMLSAEKPLSHVLAYPKLSDIIDNRSHKKVAKSPWIFPMKSQNLVADSVLPNGKFNSTEYPDPRNVLHVKATTKRRLPRQLSCPTDFTDSVSIYTPGSHSPSCCSCYDSTLVENPNIDSLTNRQNRLSTCQKNRPIASSRLLSPPKRMDERPKSFLARKFSCPLIIAESSGSAETFTASSLSNSCEEFQSIDDGKEQTPSDRRLGNSWHRKSLTRQVPFPEITDHSSDSLSCSLLHLCDHSSQYSKGEERPRCRLNSSMLLNCEAPWCPSTANYHQRSFGTRLKYPITRCTCLCHDHDNEYDRNTNVTKSNDHKITNEGKIKHLKTLNTYYEYPKYTLSPNSSSSHPRLQTQRSFSSPDTRPSIIQQPDPTCTARRHRHSISGQMSYFKLLGYNVSKKLTGSTNSLFSTAVISGSSSAPNLKDMVPPHASAVAAIEGFGGVPPIRPLETLHNALSLRQLDSFLDMMTNAALFRTPASSPPKFPSPGGSVHGGSVIPNLSICNINREYHPSDLEAVRYITPTPMLYKSGLDGEANDNRNQLSPTSPNSAGWSSEPQSFLSSGPSSPAPTSAGECSMSISLVSSDGTQPFASSKASTTPRLDIEFNDFCRSIDQEMHAESRGSISYTDYYSNEDGLIRKTGSDLTHLRERVAHDEMSQDAVIDDDEEHTLTLRETEEHRKQDVKSIFDQNKEHSLVKPSSSYKKIGRFRVESMEIADEDVRIKGAVGPENPEAASISTSNLSLDRVKTARLKNRQKVKTIARSQSVSTPQSASRKTDVDYSCQTAATNTGSFSTMSCEDLETWKRTAASPSASSVTSPIDVQEEPILTVASSLKGSSKIIIGFNVQDKEN